jgi:hypothetical protein
MDSSSYKEREDLERLEMNADQWDKAARVAKEKGG